MTDAPFDPANLPLRMLTSEVCEAARISKRSLFRRMANGMIDLQPIDRGREKIFRRADVIRAFDLGDGPLVPSVEPPARSWEAPDPATFKAQIEAARRQQRKPPKLAPVDEVKPLTPQHHRAVRLGIARGIRVMEDADGRFTVSFHSPRNARASDWPAVICLPRAAPGPVTLATEREFEDLKTEVAGIRAECRAALRAEKTKVSL